MFALRMLLVIGLIGRAGVNHGSAQNLVPNPSFETGATAPANWTLSQPGDGVWESFGRTGSRCVSISGTGGTCGRVWRNSSVPVQPGQPYLFRFWGMTSNVFAANNTTITGFDVATRDLNLTPQWAPYSYVTVLPHNAVNPLLRLGQCQVNGTLRFDDVAVLPVLPLHTQVAGLALGTGESFNAGKYTFQTTLTNGGSGNYARPLQQHTAAFVNDGWIITTNTSVTYRHRFPGLVCTNGQIKVTAKTQLGALIVATSTDGTNWLEAGRFTAVTPGAIAATLNTVVPASQLPAADIFVRIEAAGSFWVTSYRFDGDLPGSPVSATGKTWFFERQTPDMEVIPLSVAETPGGFLLDLQLGNPTLTNREISVLGSVAGSTGTRERTLVQTVAAQSTNVVTLELPSAGPGANVATITVRNPAEDTVLFTGSITFDVTWFRDSSYGYLLPGPTNGAVWWCEGTYKVNRNRFPPTSTNSAVRLSAARNEAETFQVVLRPEHSRSNVMVTASSLLQTNTGALIPAGAVEINIVEYVPVTQLFDSTGELGDYPDPLPPLPDPLTIVAHTNQPLWLTIHVPKDAPAGTYAGNILIQTEAESLSIPVELTVFNFTLSDVTHTRTAYGLVLNEAWHNPTNELQRQQIWDLYMTNFSRHRISPYLPQKYAPIQFTLNGDSFNYDFAAFDNAMEHYLEELNFNSFNWNEERSSGTITLGGHDRFSAPYRELFRKLMPPITQHLREKGWLEQAYSYWFDEPQPKHYPFVRAGMELLEQAAPGLRRLLTIYPDPPLYGVVDTWCPIFVSSVYDLAAPRWPERRQQGEDLWWYVASNPYSPLPNNFTEQPALYPRIRSWMAEKFGLTGELYWQAAYGYAEGYVPWNPWTNAMSYNGGGGPWGNGNGLLLYPPTRTLPTTPVIAPPVSSLRWEMLREAQEDREYFWLLRELLAQAESRRSPNDPAVLEGHAARTAALDLITSPQVIAADPQQLFAARARLAAAIEGLNAGEPWIVRPPRSQAVAPGQTVTLRAEALGAIPLYYQWRQNGTNLVGANTPILTLTNLNPDRAGNFDVVVTNAMGCVTSTIGSLVGKWESAPQLLTQPADLVRPVGGSAIFAVTAVSSNPVVYRWFSSGTEIPGATNATLLLTPLAATQAGNYQVIASNSAGAVTSRLATLAIPLLQSNFTLVSPGAVWRYQDQGVNLGIAWRAGNYNDSGWSSGPAQLGYGEGDEQTVVNSGPNATNKYITTYFRHTFQNPFAATPGYLIARMLRDDGAVAYLNGSEVYRSQNLPGGTINFDTLATGGFFDPLEVTGENENLFFPLAIPVQYLNPGLNTLAVEVHQFSPTSDDLSFDLELSGTWYLPPQIITSPANVTNRPGQNATFQVNAASALPVTYQWNFNQSPLPAATNAVLSITGLNQSHAGIYTVVASNSSGAVTSAPATLTLLPGPVLSGNWAADETGFQLHLPGDPASWTLLSSSNLTDWTELFTSVAGTGPVTVTDTNAIRMPLRFYRLKLN